MQTFLIFVYLTYFFYSLLSPTKDLIVEFLDVGFGDSALITTTHGKRILIDGGGNYEVMGYLGERMPPGFCHLDVVVLTHPHADHLFGLDRVLDYCDVSVVFSNDVDYDSDLYDTWKEELVSKKMNVKRLYVGETFFVDDVEFISFWPDKDYYSDNVNNLSEVILMDTGDFEVLFAGDVEVQALSRVSIQNLRNHVDDGVVEVVKVPHHGSKTAMFKDLYAQLKPGSCVISVGENTYNLPSEDVISHLENIGCRVRRTDFEGTIRVVYNLRK